MGKSIDEIKVMFDAAQYKKDSKVYFRGTLSTRRKTTLREEFPHPRKHPFQINVTERMNESMILLKKHGYLLDLPGYKPWSVRLKYLFLTESVIIRIAFYNSQRNEKSPMYQYFDYLAKPNRDYILLSYDVDYDKPLSTQQLQTIREDILKEYHRLEKDTQAREELTKNAYSVGEKITVEHALEYMHRCLLRYRLKFAE